MVSAIFPLLSTGHLAATAAELAAGDELVGLARVIDGGTRVGQQVKLVDLNAPEVHQQCRRKAGGSWPCGDDDAGCTSPTAR